MWIPCVLCCLCLIYLAPHCIALHYIMSDFSTSSYAVPCRTKTHSSSLPHHPPNSAPDTASRVALCLIDLGVCWYMVVGFHHAATAVSDYIVCLATCMVCGFGRRRRGAECGAGLDICTGSSSSSCEEL